jgi:hypothetical protein
MMHHENNSLEMNLCCQLRNNHAQAQAQTALSGISDCREFSNIPARTGTLGAFSMAPLFVFWPRPSARREREDQLTLLFPSTMIFCLQPPAHHITIDITSFCT